MKLHLSKWLGLVQLLAPIVLANVKGGEKIAPIIPVIVNGITEAEQIKGASGAEKKDHVLNVVKAGVTAVNATGKVKLDSGEVEAIASQGIDTVIASIHVVEGAKVVKAPANGTTGD